MTYQEKEKARALARAAVARGDIAKGPCEVCGSGEVELHHDDYEKPLEVRMLCKKHHQELHARISRPISGATFKALRKAAGVTVTAAAAGMEVCRAWVGKVEAGKARAPDRFAVYYAQNFDQEKDR